MHNIEVLVRILHSCEALPQMQGYFDLITKNAPTKKKLCVNPIFILKDTLWQIVLQFKQALFLLDLLLQIVLAFLRVRQRENILKNLLTRGI